MFSFFHRTPEIHLDCFTSNPNVYKDTPIVYASKTMPDWWKELPGFKPGFDENFQRITNTNAKQCYGFLELYKRGVVIEHWTDLTVRTFDNQYRYIWCDGERPGSHPDSQLGNGFKDYHNMKLISPWTFTEKTGVKFLWLGAEWALDKIDIKVLPGIINFATMSGPTNVIFMFPRRDNEFTIPIGQPIVHLVPLSEKKLKVKNHLVTEEEYRTKMVYTSNRSFYGWRKIIELTERNKERQKKCPFGFGE